MDHPAASSRRRTCRIAAAGAAIVAALLLGMGLAAHLPRTAIGASTNISSGGNAHWAWNDAIGWIDFYSPGTVTVSATGLTGYASSSVGPISFDCATAPSGNICGTSNYQVVNDGTGNLSGWAWNDGVGWISFCGGKNTATCPGTVSYQVTIDSNGNFHGWAWNDAIGWIDFNCANNTSCATSNFYVATQWVATGTVGTLESIPYDTGDVQGAQLDSVKWEGTQPPGTTVEFQFAVSNSSSGPWNFTGPDGTPNTYYDPTGPNVPLPLNYTLYNNYRYFRYIVTLVSTSTSTPVVNNVIVNWSP
jgi:hypothetical protein